jgi:N-acetyl-anhydromuramyl-L-alanine amidase AmpD
MSRKLPILRPIRAASSVSRRTRVVWGAFAAAMTLACGVLVLGDAEGPRPVVMAVPELESRTDLGVNPREARLDRKRWDAIVIHHSGTPAGDGASIARMHAEQGLVGLGYHFVIGNGQGLGDGAIEVGARWNRQQPGAHVASRAHVAGAAPVAVSSADHLNEHAVAICLVGNGDRRRFTDRQIRELSSLVRRLQRELGIAADRVYLHGDVAPVSSPGVHFPAAEFEGQLLRTSG